MVRYSPQEFPRPEPTLYLLIQNILAYQEQNDVAREQSLRCSRPISLHDLPRINQRREVEADDVHL
jgi:hypothetical protein